MSYNSVIVPVASSMVATWKGIKIPIKVNLSVYPEMVEFRGDLFRYHIELNTNDYLKYGIGSSDRTLGQASAHPFHDFTRNMFKEGSYGFKSKEVDAYLLTYENPFHESYPCVCCRLPFGKIQGVCHICVDAIDKILHGKYHIWNNPKGEEWEEMLRRSKILEEWQCNDAKKGKQDTFISSWEEVYKNEIKHVEDRYNRKYFPQYASHWPGFYLGNYKWDRMEHLLEQCILPKLDEDGVVIPSSQ